MGGYGEIGLLGNILQFSVTNTDLKYLFRILAFSDALVMAFLSADLRVLMPTFSCFLVFMYCQKGFLSFSDEIILVIYDLC